MLCCCTICCKIESVIAKSQAQAPTQYFWCESITSRTAETETRQTSMRADSQVVCWTLQSKITAVQVLEVQARAKVCQAQLALVHLRGHEIGYFTLIWSRLQVAMAICSELTHEQKVHRCGIWGRGNSLSNKPVFPQPSSFSHYQHSKEPEAHRSGAHLLHLWWLMGWKNHPPFPCCSPRCPSDPPNKTLRLTRVISACTFSVLIKFLTAEQWQSGCHDP